MSMRATGPAPASPPARPSFGRSGRRLLGQLRPDAGLVATIVGLSVVTIAMSLVVPLLYGRATNLIFDSVVGTAGLDLGALGATVLAAVVIGVLVFGCTTLQGRLTARVAEQLAFRLREQAVAKLGRLPLRHFDRVPRGELMSRITNDVDNISDTLQRAFKETVSALLTIVGVVALMLWLSPLLTLIALVTVPTSVLAAALIGRRAQPQFREQWAATGRLNAHVEEIYTGHAVVKAFGRQREAAEAFHAHNNDLFTAGFRAQFVSSIIQPAVTFLGNITYVLIAVVGALRVASGTMTLGDVQAFIQYTEEFSYPLSNAASMANLMQSGVASAERVFEMLDTPEQEPDPVPARRLARVTGRVSFDNISFRYEPDKPLIEQLSLVVEPGRTAAIVGPTGAGKTTLVNLLMRFYEVTGGRITLDGVPIAELTRDELRRHAGIVLQDTWLFTGTIAENIGYGVDGAPRERIIEAARATHVDSFVRTLPDGYDTVIDDGGGDLSAGERQLITIARTYLAAPAVLVLDEATSAVDTRTEMLVQQAMGSLRQDRTSFVIAHRLSTIRDADVILVMESGRIVEQGRHEELLAAGGPYARLYRAQFQRVAAAVD